MSLAAEGVLQHRGLEPLALALLAARLDGRHDAELGVDHAGAVAGRAGPLGVRAEQGRLHPVGLGEGLADRVQQAGVRRRVAAPRPPDRALVDDHHAVAAGDRAVDQRALAGAGHPGDARTSTPSGTSTSTSLQVVRARAPHLDAPGGASRTSSLSAARSSRCRPVTVSLPRSPSTAPSKHHLPPSVPAPGPRSTTWSAIAIVSGLCSTTSTVLPLSRSCSSSSFIRCDVVRVQPDGGLVEDVGDVGQGRSRGAGSSWCAAPRRRTASRRGGRARGSPGRSRRTSREVLRAPPSSGATDGLVQVARPTSARSLICMAHSSAMFAPRDLRGPGRGASAGCPSHSGQVAEGDRPLDERPHVRLHRLEVLGEHRLLDLRDQPLVGEVDALDLDLGRLPVQQRRRARLLGERP